MEKGARFLEKVARFLKKGARFLEKGARFFEKGALPGFVSHESTVHLFNCLAMLYV